VRTISIHKTGKSSLGAKLSIFVFAVIACLHGNCSFAQGGSQTSAALTPVEVGAPTEIPPAIASAVGSPDRSAQDKALDPGRKPEQVMAFFGIAPGMQVADLFAGGGYETEILSRIVGPGGKVYSQNPPFPPKFKQVGDNWHKRLAEPGLSNVVAIQKPLTNPDFLSVSPGSLDAVLIVLNYHDLVGFKTDMSVINGAVFKALKPAGVYGIVDHSAQNGSGIRDVSTLHRIDESVVIDQVQKTGFKLAAASNVLRHPEDDRTWYVFAHRGETDRFVLKFVKP
jgi:predicted methyltransferase